MTDKGSKALMDEWDWDDGSSLSLHTVALTEPPLGDVYVLLLTSAKSRIDDRVTRDRAIRDSAPDPEF